jgi:hypothetical protein
LGQLSFTSETTDLGARVAELYTLQELGDTYFKALGEDFKRAKARFFLTSFDV